MTDEGGDAWWTRPAPTVPAGGDTKPPAHPAASWSRTVTPGTQRGTGPRRRGPRPQPPPRRQPAQPPQQPQRLRQPPPARPPARPVPGDRSPAPFGDQRGLTAAGAVLLVLLLGALGAGVDVATGQGLRTVFTIALTAAVVLAAATVHTEDLLASVVLVPLTFAGLAAFAGIVEGAHADLTSPTAFLRAVAIVMVRAAPALMLATGAAALVAGVRAYGVRTRRRRSRAANLPYIP